MNLPEIYAELKKRLNRLDFSSLFPNFHPFRFAVYTGRECYFDGRYIQKPAGFCANTAISYGGEFIAIWKLDRKPESYDALTASIVHEMFHAFQLAQGETRYADEMEALLRYRYDVENLSMKLAEAGLMRRVLEENDAGAIAPLLRLRRARWQAFPYEYEYEAKVEQIEGTANYVELQALAQLDAEAGRRAWARVLARLTEPSLYFPIRTGCYSTGAALLSCIRTHSQTDCSAFTDTPFSVAVLADVPAAHISTPLSAGAEAILAEYKAETHRVITAAVEAGQCVLEGAYPLVSVNIYDARREGDFVTSKQFLAYWDGGAEKVIDGDFVIQLDGPSTIRKVFHQARF